MKNLVSILLLYLLLLIACANNNNQIPKSLSSTYDGTWDGSAQTPGGDQYIKMEIKDGIVSGFLEYNGGRFGSPENKIINGYVNSNNNLILNSINIRQSAWRAGLPPRIFIETSFMSPDRIEGTYYVAQVHLNKTVGNKWYVVKPATGKSDSTISNVEGN